MIQDFCDITLCSLVWGSWCFEGSHIPSSGTSSADEGTILGLPVILSKYPPQNSVILPLNKWEMWHTFCDASVNY